MKKTTRKKNGNIHPTRIFKTPEALHKAWEDYKEDTKEQSHEWLKVQYVGKEGERVTDAQKIPYTLEGFERFCYSRFGNVGQYFDNKDGYYNDFVAVCSRIRNEIRENQIIGGMLGFFNPSITQRLNNLIDRKDIKSDDKPLNEAKVVLPDGMELDDYLSKNGLK